MKSFLFAALLFLAVPLYAAETLPNPSMEMLGKVALLKEKKIPLIDYHIHIRGGMTPEKAADGANRTGIRSGVLENVGKGWPLSDNEKLQAFIENAQEFPELLIGIQVNDRDWFKMIDPALRKKLDFVLADTMIMDEQKLWLEDEYKIEDVNAWLERYFAHCMTVVNEPVTILANPTYLPPRVADRYDEFWNAERMNKFLDAAVKNNVAMEIQAGSNFPNKKFIELAIKKGVKITIGRNNFDDKPNELERCLDWLQELNIKPEQMLNLSRPIKVGDVVYKNSFAPGTMVIDTPDEVPQSQSLSLVDGATRVSLPANGDKKHQTVTIPLFLAEKLRGTRIRITGKIKAENVVKPPQPYNGIKMMLVLDNGIDGPGDRQWLQQNNVWGTFDWKEISFTVAVPNDTTSMNLVLGLENSTGTVWFDDVSIKVISKKPEKPTNKPAGIVYKGHNLPRLRGAMVQPNTFKSEDLKVLAGDWKANHIRWQLIWNSFPNSPADTATVAEYNAWMDKQCEQLDKMLPELEKYGVRVTLDVHTPPGGRFPKESSDTEMRMFHEKEFQDAFVAIWQKLARKYKDAKAVWAYDLVNEPVEGVIPEGKGLLDWRALALKTSKEIRKIDPDTAIVIEPAPWGGGPALEWLEPFDPKEVPNVVYSVHMYLPFGFTHQGVGNDKLGAVYPGNVDGKDWNKDQIRKTLQIVKDFSDDYGVAIYIGEFGSIRWAPDNSSYRYLKDCIEVFEENGWDWAYHAFREWNGWSVEHGADRNDNERTAEPTDRQKLLRSWFEKNER